MKAYIGPKYNLVSAGPVERIIPIFQSIGLASGPVSARKPELQGVKQSTPQKTPARSEWAPVPELWCHMRVSHWGPGQLRGSYKAENNAGAIVAGQLWVPNCKLFPLWLQLQTYVIEASLCLEHIQLCHRKGASGGTFHRAAQVHLLLVSWSQRLPWDIPYLWQGQPTLGGQNIQELSQARGELILICPESGLVFTWHTCWGPVGRTKTSLGRGGRRAGLGTSRRGFWLSLYHRWLELNNLTLLSLSLTTGKMGRLCWIPLYSPYRPLA